MATNGETPERPVRVLPDGSRMPMIGLGVWQVPDGPECVRAVRWALEIGYRHIDTAQGYGNEASVGTALRDSGLSREEVFITTKFLPRLRDPVAAVQQSLGRLGTDYVDLYLIHWPQGGPTWAWPGMERAVELKHARSIGVSNFSEAELASVAATAGIKPAVDQVNFNPYASRQALRGACERLGVVLEAYSPLGTGRLLSDRTVGRVAAECGRTPAQVLLRWCVQRGIPVIPKSTHRERITENLRIFDFDLSPEALASLDGLDKTGGTGVAQARKWW